MELRWRNVALVAMRELLENARTKGFWISLFGLPVFFAIAFSIPLIVQQREGPVHYAVLDQSGWTFPAVHQQIVETDISRLLSRLDKLRADDERYAAVPEFLQLFDAQMQAMEPEQRQQAASDIARLISSLMRDSLTIIEPDTATEALVAWYIRNPDAVAALVPDVSLRRYRYLHTPGASRAALNGLLQQERIRGYFVIPPDPVADASGAAYVSRNLTSVEVQEWFNRQVDRLLREERIKEQNVPADMIDWILQPTQFQALRLTPEGLEDEAGIGDMLTQWAPVAFVYFLWIAIFSVSQMLVTSTIDEKSNKLIEVLLSSISAAELLGGKILGIAMTGISIVGGWILMLALLLSLIPGGWMGLFGTDLVGILFNPTYLGSFIVYFILGFLFYAALLSGIGSFANNLKEAQTLIFPAQAVLILPLLLMFPIARDPSGTLAQVLSWIPPFTPFAMMNRAAHPPGMLTYVLTTLLLVISIYFALRLAAKIFSTGILTSGQPPRLSQMLKLIWR